MAVTLNGIDIETLISISESQRPRLATSPLGIHSLVLAQSMKATLHQYQVKCIWSGGNSDFTAKKAKLHNLADSGMPVWFDATDWSTNSLIFGKISDVAINQSEGRVNIFDVTFLVTGVFPWGYLLITDDGGTSDFRIYDEDKMVQSRTLNPLLRDCSYTKTGVSSGTISFSFYVKNIGIGSGQITLEMMVPDNINTGAVSVSQTVTEFAEDLGNAAISNTPGTLRRVTFKRNLGTLVEELWTVTITYSSLKTSFLDGSVDDIVG